MMLWEYLKSRISRYPKSILRDENREHTYKQYEYHIEVLAEKLLNILHQGTKCAVICKSEYNSGLALLACIAAGITGVPLSLRYGELHCRKILETTSPTMVLTDSDDCLKNIGVYSGGIYNLSKGLQRAPISTESEGDLLDIALIMCTSGTTGLPKGAMISESNLWHNVRDIDKYFKICNTDKILITRPLYHCAVFTGEFLISLCNGLDIHFYNNEFNPVKVLKCIENRQTTVLCGTPTLFGYLCSYANRMKMRLLLHTCAVSGECMTSKTARLMTECLPCTKVYNVYGLTEASPRVSYLPPAYFTEYPFSVGIPLRSVSLKVVDENGAEAADDVNGELLVSGPNVMKGYYRNPAATKAALRDGWLHTGDIARKNRSGFLSIISRMDNMIIRAGMNIYPQEIENALRSDGRISDVLAYGIPDENAGQQISLKVVPAESLTKADVYAICKEKLSLYQLPDRIEIVDMLPRNGSGKIIRPKAGT